MFHLVQLSAASVLHVGKYSQLRIRSTSIGKGVTQGIGFVSILRLSAWYARLTAIGDSRLGIKGSPPFGG
jgi:hypothetical protein